MPTPYGNFYKDCDSTTPHWHQCPMPHHASWHVLDYGHVPDTDIRQARPCLCFSSASLENVIQRPGTTTLDIHALDISLICLFIANVPLFFAPQDL